MGTYDETILQHMPQLLVHHIGRLISSLLQATKTFKYKSHSDTEVQGCSHNYRKGWDWGSELHHTVTL